MNKQIESVLEGFQIINKTEKTKEIYMERTQQLIRRAKKELDINANEEIDVRQFVIWLHEKKSTISKNTWRQYKSSVVYYLENHQDYEASTEALEYLKEKTSIGALTKTNKTSSLKLKKISFQDWEKLDNFLKTKNKKWYEQLRYWLRSSILTGLRPVEWKNAVMINHKGQPALRITNAKQTNGRSHGETRTLLLTNLKPEDITKIKTHLNNIRTFVGMDEYDYFYKGCSVALYKACRECWPKRKKHITLYSTRHQFSANAKSSGFNTLEVAAMMGHAVDITATIHYGRKLAGNESLGITPIEEEVLKIKKSKVRDFKTIASGSISVQTGGAIK